MKLTIATSQFPVSADIKNNLKYILKQMHYAKKSGADVIHFPEAALSGYAGVDFNSYEGFDWKTLKESTLKIMELSAKLGLWVILGSSHQLSGKHKPHNSLYIINNHGEIIDRYDKLFCSGDKTEKQGDLAHYTSGNHFSTFSINGISCGVLICHDFRYPELYREYKRKNIQVMFHSYHAGNVSPERLKEMQTGISPEIIKINPASTIPGITMPAGMISSAANNHMWISCSNTSARQSCWASFAVRPDGMFSGRLKLNTAGILITKIDTDEEFYDSTVAWRDRVMNGVFNSGTLVNDNRSEDRFKL